MKLKNAVFAMKEAILGQQHGDLAKDQVIQNLEQENHLNPGTLAFYYNHLMLQNQTNYTQQNTQSQDGKKINRKWTQHELDFMFRYIKERQKEGALNITEILEEIAELLNRGYQSVNYKYYSIVKAKEKKGASQQQQQSYRYTTIDADEVPVLSLTTEHSTTEAQPRVDYLQKAKGQIATESEDNLLDVLSGLITNIQHLPGIQLNELLHSLFQLTNLALANQNVVEQIETIKTETNQEKTALQEKLKQQEQLLRDEKRRNEQLQHDFAALANEIIAYNQLTDAAKIQNLKTYNKRLTSIISGYEQESKLGSIG